MMPMTQAALRNWVARLIWERERGWVCRICCVYLFHHSFFSSGGDSKVLSSIILYLRTPGCRNSNMQLAITMSSKFQEFKTLTCTPRLSQPSICSNIALMDRQFVSIVHGFLRKLYSQVKHVLLFDIFICLTTINWCQTLQYDYSMDDYSMDGDGPSLPVRNTMTEHRNNATSVAMAGFRCWFWV